MKKAFVWIGVVLLSPILLFVLLAVLLYLPPVQNWAVKQVAAIASEETGMQITVEHVNLEFPLDLGVDGFRAIHEGDTLADVGHLTVDVQLRPLLSQKVVVNTLELTDTRLNTNGFLSDLQVAGSLRRLALRSRGIDLAQQLVEIDEATLDDAALRVVLSDTAATDTTQSETLWRINIARAAINRSSLDLHMPGDTMRVQAYMGEAVAETGVVDLGLGLYTVEHFHWHDGQLLYDLPLEPATEGLDVNHVALSDVNIGIDSIFFRAPSLSLSIGYARMKEKSGLEVKELSTAVLMDDQRLHLPHLVLRTPDSGIEAMVRMDLNVMDSLNPGRMDVDLNAQLGKQDLLRFAGDLPQPLIRQYPNQPISIKGSAHGNTQLLQLDGVDISLPTAFHASASGTLANVTDPTRLKADVRLKAQSQNLNFLLAALGTQPSALAIPRGITLDGTARADGERYTADLTAREGKGTVKLKGTFDGRAERYDADLHVAQLDVRHFLPGDSIGLVTADVKASGRGFDFFSKRTTLQADATITQLQYGHWDLTDVTAHANMSDGRAIAQLESHNPLLDGRVDADALMVPDHLQATIAADLNRADLFRMRLTDAPLAVGLCGHIDVTSDLKQQHRLSGLLNDLYLQDSTQLYRPKDVGLLANTTPDTTYLRLQSGDFILKFDASGGYEPLISQSLALMDSVKSQYDHNIIDQPLIKSMLPTAKLYVTSGRDNPIANLLRTNQIDYKQLLVDINTSAETGINGEAHLYSLNYDSIRLDTIALRLVQKGDRLTYNGQVTNNRRNPQFVFNALFDGTIHPKGGLVGLRYYDDRGRMGVRLGATAEMEDEGLRFRLMPERPTVGYKEFALNKDNYIFLDHNNRVSANVDMVADDKTGVKLYSVESTETADSTALDAPPATLQDLTLSLNRIDLGELTSVMPYLPRITGILNGDYHIVQDQQEHFSVVSDMAMQQMSYEGAPIGNLSTELVYMQREDDSHAVEARLMLDDEEFGLLQGSVKPSSEPDGETGIDATFQMTRMPLSLANGFVPDQLLGLDGYGEGSIAIKGTTSRPLVDGEVYLDSAYLVSQPYGVRMRFDNDPVRIVGSHLLLENFGLYAYNDEPFNLMGDIDFTDTDHITMDLRMRARNLLLIDAKQTAKSIAFGKAYVNFFARMQGPLDQLGVRGRLDVLGSTDMTYMLLDSPLSTDNRLDELVRFTDFSDTTQTVVTRPAPDGLDVNLSISVSEGAHIVCNLNAEETNYIDLMGGGDLRLKYNTDGISLTGRYTLSNGEMKYSLPVIPLKTFTIKDGSYVEFTGDPMNPTLNITATERNKASVGEQGRSVAFDCGVVITQTLSNMGLQFIIEAPEDMTINSELQAMSTEERAKLAVTMLTTGMYLADGNTGGFSMNSALSSFLQGEINSITGSALKTLDLSVGLDNTTDATGATHTDYSFKFAKRFMNNRLKIQLGGKVSSGAEIEGQKQSFFDNVTMEYRLDQNSTKNVKLFYNQNVYDWLEGYTGEYGAGFVWRRKVDSFWDIFRIWGSSQQTVMPTLRQPGTSVAPATPLPADTIRTDSTNTPTHEQK